MTDEIQEYPTISAAKDIGCDISYLAKRLKDKYTKPLKGKYICKYYEDGSEDLKSTPQNTKVKLEVTNTETNVVTVYSSIRSAAKSLGYSNSSLITYLKEEGRCEPRFFKDIYIIKKV